MKLICALCLSCAACFAQVPTPRPEPAATSYDTSELNLLPSYTRATFQAAFGKDAPDFDLSRPPKSWFDSTQTCSPNGKSNYQVLSGSNLTPLTISSCDAATVNLPPAGQPQFPAAVEVHDSGVRYTGMVDLDTYLQAAVNRIEVAAMTATTPIDVSKMAAQVQPDAQYVCNWQSLNDASFHGGVDPNCGNPVALVSKYSGLVTTWAQAAAVVQDLMGVVSGTPCKFCDAIAKAPVPMPVRPLYADEKISVLGIMGGFVVLRIPPPTPVTVQGGTFTDVDRQALQQVLQILKLLTGQK
jgi:hypothetical protein